MASQPTTLASPRALGRLSPLEEAGAELHAQYAANRIINPGERDPLARPRQWCSPKGAHCSGTIIIDARQHGLSTGIAVIAIHLLVTIPVAYHHTIKAQAPLEHFCQQVAMAMNSGPASC